MKNLLKRILIPIKSEKGVDWGVFHKSGTAHELAACRPKITRKEISFSNGHRMRQVKIKDTFYWKIPEGSGVDIRLVPPSSSPPRR